MHKHQHKNTHSKPKKKRLGLFYGTASSLAIIAFIAIFYFAVLVSAKPRSILLVTQKIESVLQEKFGRDNVSIDRTFLSFTNYGTLKINISGLRILYPDTYGTGKKSFIIPDLETEFSLLNFLRLRFQPSKIKVSNPNIFLGDWQKFTSGNKVSSTKQSDLSLIATLLSSIRKGENPIENFEIENAKLLVHGENFEREILLKKSQIQVISKGNNLVILSQNNLSLNTEEGDVTLSSNCKISENIICDLSLQNLSPNSISELHPSLAELSKINAALSANISFAFNNDELGDLKFKIYSEKGDFEFQDFFAKKMHFKDLSVTGGFNHKTKILDLSQIETDFLDAANPTNKPHLSMSLLISTLEDAPGNKLDFNIQLQNVLGDELQKFWPITLQENGIREWVTTKVTEGVIKTASAKFTLTQIKDEFFLDKISAKAVFSGINLKYSLDFPEIKNIAATANFTRENMKIVITGGEFLQTKISEGLVEIDDFAAKTVMLKISGKANGHAENGLNFANNNPEFTKEVTQYLNGDAQSNFDIRLPISEEVTLKNSYIAVNSIIAGLKNDYLQGGSIVNSKKDFDSVDFVTNIDLAAAELSSNPFNLTKKSGVESQLNLVVSVLSPQEIRIKNIALSKKEKTGQLEKFNGNIAFQTSPFLIKSANFKNTNFDKNNYLVTYLSDAKTNSHKISWRGDRINLGAFLKQKTSDGDFPDLTLQIVANHAELLKNKTLRNLHLSINCTKGLCSKGLLRANYNKQNSLNLRINKAEEDYLVTGRITDIGYLADALGISDVVSGGDAKLKIQHYAINNKPVLKGTLTIDNNITIYENAAVKRFSKDTLFSQIRDTIFASDKTIFNSVKLEFHLQNYLLNIDSLIANNYKIGITAKGSINLISQSCQLKGMIIPGFIVNNLFGIGKIPLVGGVISGLLTGGEGGGLFGIRYEYDKKPGDKEAKFTTNKVSAFVPSTLQNLFD